jgi:hypothetical protein
MRIGRLGGWVVVLGVVGAAAWALTVLLSSRLNETDGRVILTSLAFAAASTTAASGVAATLRSSWGMRALGVATIGCSVAAFGLLTALIWQRALPFEETLLRACGCAVVLAIATAHASLMLRGRRPSDGAVVDVVTFGSLTFGSVDAVGALLPLAEIVDRISESWARILGAVLVLLIATTILAPLLRRLQTASEQPAMQLAA